jgi:hypothetical protein
LYWYFIRRRTMTLDGLTRLTELFHWATAQNYINVVKMKLNKVKAFLSGFHLLSVIAESDSSFFHILWNYSYLREEWKERHSNMVDDFSSKFLQLRFISLEVISLHTNLTNSVQIFIDFCFSFPIFFSCLSRRTYMIAVCFCFTMWNDF